MSLEGKIRPDTTIEEIVEKYPELVRPLMEYGIQCIACGEPVWGSLQENARQKGVKNLDEILQKLNQMVMQKEKHAHEK